MITVGVVQPSQSTRTAAYAALVPVFVEAYIKLFDDTKKKIFLAKLGSVFAKIFDIQESEQVLSEEKDNSGKWTGVEQLNNSAPLLQMYDFIHTMDQFDRDLQLLDLQIQSMSTTVGAFSEIQKKIPPSDLRPWAFHKTFPSKSVMDEHDIEMTIGQQLFEPVIYDPNNDLITSSFPLPFNRERVREKTANERAQDEAHLLHYTLIGHYFALGQGLFQIRHTPAYSIAMDAMRNTMNTRAGVIGSEQWRTSLTNVNAKGAYKIPKTKIPEKSWINSMTGTDRALCRVETLIANQPYDALLVIMPKDVQLKRYPANRFHLEYEKRQFIGQEDDELMYKPFDDVYHHITEERGQHVTTSDDLIGGGPIGMYKVCWPFKKTLYEQTNTVIQISGSDIKESMSQMSWHPIFASPKLAEAYRDNGIFQNFTFRLFDLIEKNQVAKKQTPLDSSASDPTKFMRNMSIASQLQHRYRARTYVCPGPIPRYQGHRGSSMMPLEAYVANPYHSQLTLKSSVNPQTGTGSFHATTIPRAFPKPLTKYSPVAYHTKGGQPVRLFIQNETPAALLLQHFASQKAKTVVPIT